MFTGLIEAVGSVERLARTGAAARLRVSVLWPDGEAPKAGDSIAVDGACLTAIEPTSGGFSADLSSETLQRTLFHTARPGQPVNLERALRLGDRLGGHIVQGHVDGVVRVLTIRPEGEFQRWRVSLPIELTDQVAAKGSVALNGVSLTVAGLGRDWFEVALIPTTLEATSLGRLRTGAELHLETDVLAKYVAHRIGQSTPSAIDEMFGGGRGA
ncbi:MAG: riboflavin synthase [Thermoanaerobaculales bacterium]|nr:riboflavin synthase [Thermoanaerobaculales bacterium]